MTDRIWSYLIDGGDERALLLAQADCSAAHAQREAEDGDPDGMYAGLAEEARRLRAQAEAMAPAGGDEAPGHRRHERGGR